MVEGGKLGFLIADGRRAKFWTQAKRGAALEEAWAMALAEEDRAAPRDRPPRAQDSAGPHRHAMDGGRNLHEEEEVKFLKRVARRVECEHAAFKHLALAGPPRALGLLRDLLPEAAMAKLRGEAAKDVLDEDASALKARLMEMLR